MTANWAWFEQCIAQFVLHAFWQVPLLAVAAWCAVRIGRPHVRVAHALWVGTLVLCVTLPMCATVAARRAARFAERDAAASVTLSSAEYLGALPALQREPTWKRMLQRHLNLRHGLQPFAFTMSPRWASGIAAAYLLSCGFLLAQLLVALGQVWALVRASSDDHLPTAFANTLRQQCVRLGMAVSRLRISSSIGGPVLAGVLRPTLLLPEGMAESMTQAEADAVLAHELAHLRRCDPALHALCSVLVLPVLFHPAALWVSRFIRQTREMACDAEAAERLGSHVAYAHALLAVAEHMGVRSNRYSVLSFFSNGLFGAGLELFNRSGAMEERMQMIMKPNQPEARIKRAVRVATSVTLGTVAVLAAGMLQVRPALAGEQAPPPQLAAGLHAAEATSQATDAEPTLLGGENAREQLRQARRQLLEAEKQAVSEEDRRRIATARDVAAAAEGMLAPTNGTRQDADGAADLPKLKAQVANIEMPDMEALQAQLAKQQTYFDSPEWKANLAKQQGAMARQQAFLNSSEWKARMEWQQQAMKKLRAELDSPEFRARIEAAGKVDSQRIRSMMIDAERQHKQAVEQIRSGPIQRQIDAATQLVARNEVPVVVSSARDDQPAKVVSAVMAGQVLHKEVPIYPTEAKKKKIQGAVVLHAVISEEGKVEQLAIVTSPDEMLSKSALDSVRQWTYKPYLLEGRPTAVETTVTVTYSLEP